MQVLVSYTLNLVGGAKDWTQKELETYLENCSPMETTHSLLEVSTELWEVIP